jgi:hypothetical protein
LITLGGCPLLWKSHLQQRTSLSTLEAEYTAASGALRHLIPIRRLVQEVLTMVHPEHRELNSEIMTTVHEDNQACLQLMTEQKITNRTKYFLTTYHWFWEYIVGAGPKDDEDDNSSNRCIQVKKVSTDLQRANYLTKGLSRIQFERERKLTQGW